MSSDHLLYPLAIGFGCTPLLLFCSSPLCPHNIPHTKTVGFRTCFSDLHVYQISLNCFFLLDWQIQSQKHVEFPDKTVMPPVTTGRMNKPYKGIILAEPKGSLKDFPTAAFSQAAAYAACFYALVFLLSVNGSMRYFSVI